MHSTTINRTLPLRADLGVPNAERNGCARERVSRRYSRPAQFSLPIVGLFLAATAPGFAQTGPSALPGASLAVVAGSGANSPAPTSPSPYEETEIDQELSYGAETDFNSKFVWRGIVLSDKPVIQPTAWISYAGFTFLAEDNELVGNVLPRVHEHNSYVSLFYRHIWKKLLVEPMLAGFLERPPPGLYDPKTAEFSVRLSYPVGPFRAFTENAFDVVAYPGSYFGEAGMLCGKRLSSKATIAFTGHVGWASAEFNQAYIGVHTAAFNYVGLDGAATYYLKPYLYVRPHFEISDVTERQLRALLPHPAAISVGFAVGLDF